MDFLVSGSDSYRYLRNVVREQGLQVLMKSANASQHQTTDIRSDQYGIRTRVFVEGKSIKFEIVLEGRIALAKPRNKDSISGFKNHQ
jgi:hypothetical protein